MANTQYTDRATFYNDNRDNLSDPVTKDLIQMGTTNYAEHVAATLTTSAGVPMDTLPSVTPPTTFYFGRLAVTTAGTELVLATAQALTAGVVFIKALHTNTGYAYVGKNPVTSSTGYPLLAGEEVVILTDNLADIFVDVSVNGEGVAYLGS